MKQLTLVTILFLPMTFITGYFGMNFHAFASIDHSESYFWTIAVPVVIVVASWLMKDVWWRYIVKSVQRRGILKARKRRGEREKERVRSRRKAE